MRNFLLPILIPFCACLFADTGNVVSSASADMTFLDTTVATNDVTMARFQSELPVAYSAVLWNDMSQVGQTAMLAVDGDALLNAEDEGVYMWRPTRAGSHVLRLTVNGVTLAKAVHIPASEVQVERIGVNLCKLTASDGVSPIRYTLDGTDPTAESALYEGPFPIPLSRMSFVRACTQGEGYVLGEVKIAAFDISGKCDSVAETLATIDSRAGKPVVPVDGVTCVAWSGLWSSDSEAEVAVDADGVKILMSKGEGSIEYYPTSVGRHVLTHETCKDGIAIGEKLTATIDVSSVLKEGRVVEGVAQIAEGTTEIADGAFANRHDLISVTIPSSVTNIAPMAFAGCVNLTNVVICGGISGEQKRNAEVVGDTDWVEEDGLYEGDAVYRSNVIADNGSTAIEFSIPKGTEAFVYSWKVGSERNYDKLTFYLDGQYVAEISGPENEWATATNELDGASHVAKFVYSKDGSVSNPPDCGWVCVKSSPGVCTLKGIFPDSPITSVSIGEGVLSLPDGFFEGCETITSLSLPNSLKIFGDNDVREIGRRMGVEGAWIQNGWLLGYMGSAPALFECPADVRGLASYALAEQHRIKSVVLSDCLESVGCNVFAGCEELSSVFFKGDAPLADSAFFKGASSELVAFARKNSSGWSSDGNLLPDRWPESQDTRPMREWATYPKSSWLVRFELGGCGERSGGGELEQLVGDGENAVAPEVVAFVEDGYEFNGWNRDFTNVTESMTVRAKYLKDGQDIGTGFTLASGGDAQWTKVGKKYNAGNIGVGNEVWLEMRVRGTGLVGFKWWINDSSDSGQYQTTWGTSAPWKVSVDGELKEAPIYVNGADWGDSCAEFGVYGEGEHIIRWSFTRDQYRSEYNGFAVGAINWRPAPEYVTLTFDPTLGELEQKQVVVATDGTYGSLPVPSRDGVEFAGWSMDDWNPQFVSEDDMVPLVDTTLYAWWNPTKEQVIDPDGTISTLEFAEAGEEYWGDPWSVEMRYDYVDWTTNTRQYYECLRYNSYFNTPTTQTVFRATVAGVGSLRIADLYSYESSVKAYLDGEEVEMPDYSNGETAFKLLNGGEHEFRIDVERGANDSGSVYFGLGAMQWTSAPSRMVVEFDPMGGTASSLAKSCRPGQTYGALPTVAERPGYEFLGWFTDPDGGERKTEDDLVDFEITKLFAHWRAGLDVALNNNKLAFASSGPTGWEGRSGSSHDGLSAAASGWLEWNETNTLYTTVNGKGVLSFWWKVVQSVADLKFLLEVDGAQIELSRVGHAAENSNGWLHFVLSLTNDCAHAVKWLATPDSESYNEMLSWGYDPGSIREQLENRRMLGWYGQVPDPGAWVDEVAWQPNGEQEDVVLWGHSAWQARRILPGSADPMMVWCNRRIAANPNDYEAYVRRAITRIKALSESPAFKLLLSQYGFDFSPEFMMFSGEFNANMAPLSNDAVDVLAAEIVPTLEAIYADLQVVPEGWAGTVALLASEYPVDEDVYIDFADVVMAKSFAKGLQSLMHIIQSYDLTVDNQRIKAELDAWALCRQEGEESLLLTVEALLNAHPNFARSIRNQAHLDSAKAELRSALELCGAFDAAVRTRMSGKMHFFEYNPKYADQWQSVVQSVQLARTGLDEIVTVKGEDYACFKNFRQTNLNERVTLMPLFDGKILRSLLPPFEGNRPVLSSIPDITFAGTFPDWTMKNRMEWLQRIDGVWYEGTPMPTVVAPETFVGPFAEVSIEDKMAEAVIFYTIDGSDPAVYGKRYVGPFHVCDTATIRAVAFSTQNGLSEETEAHVEKLFGRGDAIGSYDGVFEDDAEAPWSIDATVAHEGGAASMRSGRIISSDEYPDRNYSTLAATYSGRGTLSFWWKVSCEDDGSEVGAEFDFLGVYVNGELVRAIDGRTDWMKVEIDLPDAVEHRIEWRYSKDDMDDDDIGDDCGWVDDVVWMSKSQTGNLTGSTLSTSPRIPYTWLDQHGLGPRNVNGGHTFEQAAKRISPYGKRDGAGKPLTVLDEYIAGTDPQNKDDTFHAILEFENGKPVIKWHPKLSPAEEALRTYRSFGRELLETGDWVELPDGKTDGFNFFKTSVEWK